MVKFETNILVTPYRVVAIVADSFGRACILYEPTYELLICNLPPKVLLFPDTDQYMLPLEFP